MTAPQTTLSILEALIGFPSVSSESNLDIVQWIEDYLSQHGVTARRIPDSTGRKASLLATIGPGGRPGVVLSAHTDVVPVAGQDWSSPPFTATARDGRIVGRGATDMKGFIASVLAHVLHFKRSATATPVHIALSYDEEVGCLGAPDLVADIAAAPVKPALCIVGEPTGLAVAYAHKGKVARRVIVTGRGGHSALPHRAVNAVSAAARICVFLDDLGERVSHKGRRDAAFDPPYTTIHVGSLHGGTALNLVPDRATLEFEIRDIPGADVASLLAQVERFLATERDRLRMQASEADILVDDISSYPALMTASTDAAVATTQRLTVRGDGARTVSFGTEAGLYAQAGIPTVVCGPGDIARAHKADEWIGTDELAASDRMMQRLAAQLGKPAELDTSMTKQPNTVTKPSLKLTHHGAMIALQAAVAKAEELGVPQNITIVDDGGNMLAYIRMDGAKLLSAETSKSKAITAASHRQPTSRLDPTLEVKLAIAAGGRLTNLEGGLPIIMGGVCIGAVGVGSGTGAQDVEVARAALKGLGAEDQVP